MTNTEALEELTERYQRLVLASDAGRTVDVQKELKIMYAHMVRFAAFLSSLEQSRL